MPDCFERPMVACVYRRRLRRDASTGLCGGFGWLLRVLCGTPAIKMVQLLNPYQCSHQCWHQCWHGDPWAMAIRAPVQ